MTVGSGLSCSNSRRVMPNRVAWRLSVRIATRRLVPSSASAITSTVTPIQNASSSGGWMSALSPSQIDTAPPTTNMPIAASSAQ